MTSGMIAPSFIFWSIRISEQRMLRSSNEPWRRRGFLVLGTFSLDGPEKCSGLPVQRYDAVSRTKHFDRSFRLKIEAHETHATPWGAPQSFIYVVMERQPTVHELNLTGERPHKKFVLGSTSRGYDRGLRDRDLRVLSHSSS